ncbi:DegT/DnrJ/EryC1/StrS family aminotransferase [Nocardiopsis sp. CNT-189]|uniref:DegT/DnrJ/EryC1/StrS family aminotransferase n=1 Tax=Nocardiopsis oceanisediminis TaxID=2816862 RepID=UPI003B3A94C8
MTAERGGTAADAPGGLRGAGSGVPFLDLRAPYAELRADVDRAVSRVLASGRYLLGPEIEAFESEFADYCGTAHCVAVNSGGDALELALRALGVGAGDDVLVPSHTFIATWIAVSATGARPVAVEPADGGTLIDAAGVEAAVTPRAKAVVPVHLYGHPVDLDPLREAARRHGLHVLEDAAQAHGARYRGRRVGAAPSLAAFSFYPGKNLGAMGDGGAVVTGDAELAGRLRMLRNYGSRVKYRHELRSGNSRLDEVQAAVLRVKLARLDEWNGRRARAAGRYRDGLGGLDWLRLPDAAPWAEHAWHVYPVRTRHRDALAGHLAAAGVQTLSHYPVPVHLSPAYASAGLPEGSLPRAERLAAELLSLPISPHLGDDRVDEVVAAVRSFRPAG